MDSATIKPSCLHPWSHWFATVLPRHPWRSTNCSIQARTFGRSSRSIGGAEGQMPSHWGGQDKEEDGKNEKMGGIDNAVWRSKIGRQWHGSLTCPLLTSGDVIVDFGRQHREQNHDKMIHNASTTKCKKFNGHDTQWKDVWVIAMIKHNTHCKEPIEDTSFQWIHLNRAIHLDVKIISDDEVRGLLFSWFATNASAWMASARSEHLVLHLMSMVKKDCDHLKLLYKK